jgi:hypothetical protein
MRRAAIVVAVLLSLAARAQTPPSTTGITLTYDEMQTLPLGRTVGQVLILAPGVDSGGLTSPAIFRSSFPALYAEGLPANVLLPVDFAEEVVIETGGVPVEYHGAGGVLDVRFRNGRQRPHGTIFGYTTPSGLQSDFDQVTLFGRQRAEVRTADFGATFGTSTERLSFFGGVDRLLFRARNETPPATSTNRSRSTAYVARLAAQATPRWTLIAELLGDPSKSVSEYESTPALSHFENDSGVDRASLRAMHTTAAWLVDGAIGHGNFRTFADSRITQETARLATEHPLATAHVVHFGGEARRSSARLAFPENGSTRLREDLTAFWLADAWQVDPSVVVTGGVRWWRDDSDQRSTGTDVIFRTRQTELDPRLSAVWAPAIGTRISASVNRYSGSPLLGPLYPVVGSDLPLESVTEAIVRAERTFGSWRAGAFVIDRHHNDFRAFVAEGSYRGASGVRAHGSYLIGNSGPSSFAARQLFEADGAYAFPVRAARLELGGVVTASTGSGTEGGFGRRKAAARLDLHGGVAFRAGSAAPRVVVDIFNVANDDRVIATTTTFEGVEIPVGWQAPRSIRLGLRLSF